MLPQRISTIGVCGLAGGWRLDPTFAGRVVTLDRWADERMAEAGLPWPGLRIFSGYRTPAQQAELNPDAPNSYHTRCPALAVDLRVGNVAASITTDAVWAWLGAQWRFMGGRWGGQFSDPDPNHFDWGVAVT